MVTDGKTADVIIKITDLGKVFSGCEFTFEKIRYTAEARDRKKKRDNDRKKLSKKRKVEKVRELRAVDELRRQLAEKDEKIIKMTEEKAKQQIYVTILENKVEEATGNEITLTKFEKKLLKKQV